MRGTRLEIFSEALLHNVQQARQRAGAAELLAMVKADAYGHGLVPVARIFAPHVDGLGVAVWEEAQTLFQAGIRKTVSVVEGFFDAEELRAGKELPVEWFVHSDWQLELLLQEKIPCAVWLKVDSGMHRLGFPPKSAAVVTRQLVAAGVQVKGLASHFATADLVDFSRAEKQKDEMLALSAALQLPLTLANSAALYRFPEATAARVRPGIMLYGSSPLENHEAADLGLKPTQRFSACIIALNPVAAGDAVSYGDHWHAPQDSRIAIVAAGYGDGYPRLTPSGTPVAVETASGIVFANTVGRVCMDMIAIDVTEIADVAIGQRVELWGEHISVDQVAAASGNLAYELFCRMTRRPERLYR